MSVSFGPTTVSLRDTFAAHAMSALIVTAKEVSREQIAEDAYTWADAMIAVRDRKKSNT